MTTSRYTIYRNQDAGVNDETKARYKLNPNKKVFVYKNLHKDCWSVKQNGLVKMHTTQLVMVACKFKVNEKGRQRVLEEQRKNVHAGIHGLIMTTQRSGNPPNKKNSFFNEKTDPKFGPLFLFLLTSKMVSVLIKQKVIKIWGYS